MDLGFQVRGALKRMAPSGGRREHFGGISCEKITILRQKIIFFPILGGRAPGARVECAPPPGSAPVLYLRFKTYVRIPFT